MTAAADTPDEKPAKKPTGPPSGALPDTQPDASPDAQAAAPRDLFDRQRRATRRGRHVRARQDYIGQQMAEILIERIDDVARTFTSAVVIGTRNTALIAGLAARGIAVTLYDANADLAAVNGGICADEDRLPLEPASQDLIIWPGGLDSVNDVPGALLRCRLALKPDGLLLGCFIGDGSLPVLRGAMAAADNGQAVARMHPQIDVRGIGDVIGRVGLNMPVIDVERLRLSYRRLGDLVADLRAAALTNVLAGPVRVLSRQSWKAAVQDFAARATSTDNGEARTAETLRIVFFSGWAPDPSQPKPARRGSATASLAQALTARPTPSAEPTPIAEPTPSAEPSPSAKPSRGTEPPRGAKIRPQD